MPNHVDRPEPDHVWSDHGGLILDQIPAVDQLAGSDPLLTVGAVPVSPSDVTRPHRAVRASPIRANSFVLSWIV